MKQWNGISLLVALGRLIGTDSYASINIAAKKLIPIVVALRMWGT